VILEADSMYRVDSDELTDDANTQMESLASALAETDGLDVLVVAHTDATGPAAYNLALSQRRAAAVGRALAGRSGSISNLETLGRGEDEPLATDETIEGRRRNSRIEIALYRSPDSQSADGA
jgi:outer membrane protein OmpA-like peptidoglycan-associated protein